MPRKYIILHFWKFKKPEKIILSRLKITLYTILGYICLAGRNNSTVAINFTSLFATLFVFFICQFLHPATVTVLGFLDHLLSTHNIKQKNITGFYFSHSQISFSVTVLGLDNTTFFYLKNFLFLYLMDFFLVKTFLFRKPPIFFIFLIFTNPPFLKNK